MKLNLWVCPVVLVALSTAVRAGTYTPIGNTDQETNTFYPPSISVGALTAFAPRISPTGATLGDDIKSNPEESSSLARKTWVWNPGTLADPAPPQSMRCTYQIACNVYASTTGTVYSAAGTADFTISGDVNKSLSYYMKVGYRGTTSNTLPPTTGGQPNTETTQYSDNGGQQELPYTGVDGSTRIRAQASTTVKNAAAVSGAYAPGQSYASSGQASIRIVDFSCPDQDPGPPPL